MYPEVLEKIAGEIMSSKPTEEQPEFELNGLAGR